MTPRNDNKDGVYGRTYSTECYGNLFWEGGRKEGEGAQLILAYVTYFTVTIDLW